jgi:hypothetical protein
VMVDGTPIRRGRGSFSDRKTFDAPLMSTKRDELFTACKVADP